MTENATEILVGYDGSPDSDAALLWAAKTAQLEGKPVSVAIIDDIGSNPRGMLWWPEPHWAELEARANELLTEAGVTQAIVHRRKGRLVPMLVALAHDASLLVVGSRGHSRAGEIFIGSVSQHLAGHAPCPVVVVREPDAPDAGRIVVGLDGSRASQDALEFACRRAELSGEKVVALRGWRVGTVPVDRRGNLPAEFGDVQAKQEALLAESVAGVRVDYPDIAIQQEAIAVAPGQALVDVSTNASLVVVGSRGLNAFAGMLLGSVSHEVLHRAHCPVAVVR
jgi:nucleotide-binding universal stress UspA family protein